MPKDTLKALVAAIAFALAACSGVARGPAAGDAEVDCKTYQLPNNPDVTPPRLIHGGQPKVPEASPRGGYVCVRATISPSGTVIDPVVVKTDNQDFAQAFLRALPDWRYEPATRGSARVSYHITLFSRFRPTK
jgi:TonB family protein